MYEVRVGFTGKQVQQVQVQTGEQAQAQAQAQVQTGKTVQVQAGNEKYRYAVYNAMGERIASVTMDGDWVILETQLTSPRARTDRFLCHNASAVLYSSVSTMLARLAGTGGMTGKQEILTR